MLEYVLIGITFAFAAAVQPGPLMAYIISETMKNGWRPTLPVSFAPIISDIPIALLILFLLHTVADSFVFVLRFGGGLFLLFLGYQAFKSWRNFDENKLIGKHVAHKTFYKAVIVNLLNPGPYLGWSLIMGPLFLEGWQDTPANSIALVAGFYITMAVTLSGIIVLFDLARKFGPRVSRTLIGVSSVLLWVFGGYQLYLGLQLTGPFHP